MSREMKHSGVAWIGEIPKHWELKRLQSQVIEINKKNCPLQTDYVLSLTIKDGVIPYDEKGDIGNKSKENHEEYKLAYPDTIVLNSMNILIGAVGICNYFGCISPVYYVLKNIENANLRYINYILSSTQFQKYLRKYANGILEIRLRVSSDDIMKRKIPVPPFAEQQAIANFLDKKCGEVDELVALQEKIIEELKAYKQSVITEAVCKGFNPNVPMKDSGVEWIGDIPEGWKVMKIKHLASVVRGGSPRPAGDPQYYEGNIPFMKVADITKDDNIFVNDCEYTIKEAGLSHTRMIEPHTLLLTNSGATLGVPKINTFKTTFNDGIAAFLDLDKSLDIYFAYYSLKARTKYFLDSASLGIGQPNLNTDIIGSTYLAIPPIEEQYDIVEFLNTKCSEIDQLISIKQQKIVELKDYKKSLIYEYTTGKKEVKL
jgi:type I restriction enzyme S subunit